MKKQKLKLFFGVLLIVPLLLASVPLDEYIVLSWNDLGMHCANKDFSTMVILPPYNNLKAQVIKRGNANTMPKIITTGLNVTYEIPGNTYSVGKTNFWTYSQGLFGVSTPNIGLTGAGLTGIMAMNTNEYFQDGIPVTPYKDNNLQTESPFQLALIKVSDGSGNLLAQTQPVIPVSNEINCVSSGCHNSEQAILNEHEIVTGFNPNNKPIKCSQCHADNALGAPGKPGVPSFSEVIHDKHKNKTNDCYKCHPGPNTQCFRDVMHKGGMICQDCHGSVGNIAQTIKNGRQPWLQEPSCGQTACHGSTYSPEPSRLYRNSRGHAGLYCSACHGSPHAIVPTEQANDNVQNISVQGWAGTLKKCSVCHGITPSLPGPHGILATGIKEISEKIPASSHLDLVYPNPVSSQAFIGLEVKESAKVKVEVYSIKGQYIETIYSSNTAPGEYKIDFKTNNLTNGVYTCIMHSGRFKDSKRFIVNR
jgi:hypothetical protein